MIRAHTIRVRYGQIVLIGNRITISIQSLHKGDAVDATRWFEEILGGAPFS
jgi:predicted RecA/RadA family phage recombinase